MDEDSKQYSIRDPQLLSFISNAPPRLSKAIEQFRSGKRAEAALPIWNNSLFSWVSDLENNWQKIRDECLALLQNNVAVTTQITASVAQGTWKTFPFLEEGNQISVNQELCPVTTALLSKVPLLRGSCLGYCYFSRIVPGTLITAHGGVSNVKLRCHLPLVVPAELDENNLGMQVGEHVVKWEEGKCLIFDDSFVHAVWHKGEPTTSDRIVLLFDFWHPDLTPAEISAITYCLAAEKPESSN